MTDKKLKAVPSGEQKIKDIAVGKDENLYVQFKNSDETFKAIKGYSLNGPFLIVLTKADEQFIYKIEDIYFIKTYFTIKE